MFGRAYFGAAYYGPRYFGDGGGIVPPTPTPPLATGGGSSRRRIGKRPRYWWEKEEEVEQAVPALPEAGPLPDFLPVKVDPLEYVPRVPFEATPVSKATEEMVAKVVKSVVDERKRKKKMKMMALSILLDDE